ncbi:MAG: hypothetical protein ACO2OT_03030 [Candidatus Caldipriscus sp.]|jgi:hypothetical protein
MLRITLWVIAPVIRDTVYKEDTCPGTKYGFSGNPPYNLNRSLTYDTVLLEHTKRS